jgi:hypothetical protein
MRSFLIFLFLYASTAQAQWADGTWPANWQVTPAQSPLGNAVILLGNLSEHEKNKDVYSINQYLGWMKDAGIRTYVVRDARAEDLRAAFSDPNTSIVIWSSHGSREGYIADSYGRFIPDGFLSGITSNVRFFAAAGCYGEQTCHRLVRGIQIFGYDRPVEGYVTYNQISTPQNRKAILNSLGGFSTVLAQNSTTAYCQNLLSSELPKPYQ